MEAVHCYALEMLCHYALRSMWMLAGYGLQLFHFCTILPAEFTWFYSAVFEAMLASARAYQGFKYCLQLLLQCRPCREHTCSYCAEYFGS